MNGSDQTLSSELANLGFRLSGFREWPLDKALKTLSTIGYKSVELCLEHPDLDPEKLNAKKITKIKESLDENGLRISSVSYHGKRDSVPDLFEKQKRGIEIALEMGIRILVVGTASSENDPDGNHTFRALEELLIAAEEAGIMLVAEPEPDTVLNGMYEFSLLASRMAGSSLGLNLDVGHASLTEGDVCAVIEEWAPFILHTHIYDIRRPKHVHLLPGEGHLDLPDLIRTLREYNYNGDLTLDLFDIADAPDEWAKKAMEKCREIFV